MQRSHKSSICEDLATGIVRVSLGGSSQIIQRPWPLLTFMDLSMQRSHKSSICEDLATGIVRVSLGVTSMLFRMRKSILYALT